ncbi:Rab geranylgeranyltransferase [Diatrype stigma]|uniref:Geranylgeranyl transferase type-2 subunit alpha n=1 Tax=Diatrype stigma TaxID=117547 RepID=A0AAN9YNS3_9PEZI
MASHGIARTERTRTRTDEQRQQELAKIETYRDLEHQVRAKVAAGAASYDDPALFQLTTKLLRLNPEYYTIWNVRRRCLISGSLCKPSAGSWPSKASPSSLPSATTRPSFAPSSLSSSAATPPSQDSPTIGGSGSTPDPEAEAEAEADADADADEETKEAKGSRTKIPQQQESDRVVLRAELDFTIPLLLGFPKCYWIWNFRRWILSQVILRLPLSQARDIWMTELGLVSKMLDKDNRNFHAWGYRRYVVATLESPALHGKSMAESELAYTQKMYEKNLSNFSAWHSRSQLIVRVLDERGADDKTRAAFLDDELALVKDALNVGPDDQSLWYYHQFLISQITSYQTQATVVPALTLQERIGYLSREIDDIKDLLVDYKDTKWIYEALLEYSIALRRLELAEGRAGEREDAHAWLAKVQDLDPMRRGRWSDVKAQFVSAK